MTESMKFFFDHVLTTIRDISVLDILDIILLSVVLFFVFRFMTDRRAGKLLLGIIVLFFLQAIVNMIGLKATSYVLSYVFQFGFLALIVIFQPELRSGLEKVGSEPMRGFRSISDKGRTAVMTKIIDQMISAANDLSASKTGALIVFERSTKLGDRILTGTIIDAEPNAYLIKNIFFNKAPLHDGALIVRNNRLYAAGCLLPLSENLDIMKSLGTRHRAAIGVSENSDAIVLVVSEETGTISIAHDGKLERFFDENSLRNRLTFFLNPNASKKTGSFSLKSNKGGNES